MRRKSLAIPLYRLYQHARRYAVKRAQLAAEHDFLATQEVNSVLNATRSNDLFISPGIHDLIIGKIH